MPCLLPAPLLSDGALQAPPSLAGARSTRGTLIIHIGFKQDECIEVG
jgi:hypothetical protein